MNGSTLVQGLRSSCTFLRDGGMYYRQVVARRYGVAFVKWARDPSCPLWDYSSGIAKDYASPSLLCRDRVDRIGEHPGAPDASCEIDWSSWDAPRLGGELVPRRRGRALDGMRLLS